MKTSNSLGLVILTLLLVFCRNVSAAVQPLTIQGKYFIRLPDSSRFSENPVDERIPDGSIVSIPKVRNASTSILLLNGHKVVLYPGATFKWRKTVLTPLSGRFEFSSEEGSGFDSVNIATKNCNAGYKYGRFLIEATPDNGVFFAMRNSGSAWIKDIYRNVFELKAGQQIHIPLFGQAVSKNRLEAFWGKESSSFANLGEVGQEASYGIVGQDF